MGADKDKCQGRAKTMVLQDPAIMKSMWLAGGFPHAIMVLERS